MGAKKTKVKEDSEEQKKVDKSKEKKPEKKIIKSIEGVKGMVRLADFNLDGQKKVRNAVLGITGIGKSLAGGVVSVSGVNPDAMLGTLTDGEIEKLEDALRNPAKYGVPVHMLNRRADPNTGENRHLVSSDLTFNVKADIDFMKKIRCYKGIRHELGQPVRGQRTKSSFRTGMQVGVTKAKLKPGAAPGAPGVPGTVPAAGAAPAGAKPVAGAKPAAGAKLGAPAAGAKMPAAPAGAAPAKKEEKKK